MSKSKRILAVGCMMFLAACGTLPKERFLRANSDQSKYELHETSILVLRNAASSWVTQKLNAYASVKEKFPNHPELAQYVERRSARLDKIHDAEMNRIAQLESRMSPGDTLYQFIMTRGETVEGGILILDRKGRVVWREIEQANYPFWEGTTE